MNKNPALNKGNMMLSREKESEKVKRDEIDGKKQIFCTVITIIIIVITIIIFIIIPAPKRNFF